MAAHRYQPNVTNCTTHNLGDCYKHPGGPCQAPYVDGSNNVCGQYRYSLDHAAPADPERPLLTTTWVTDDHADLTLTAHGATTSLGDVNWDDHGRAMRPVLNLVEHLARLLGADTNVEGVPGR